ncbi:hypothetical protein [Candidatus Borrarchaeum sp.]|uniref:hypothetical protein n=1 Tax=Candidatus Borrarchaeum sp. TaxID=2846742 RepID=UPI00257D290C|nr:hypothetical protein [Candidatus Borrarchaeum sp.]
MKVIEKGRSLDYETYEFIRDCGITAIVLLKFDLTMGPYIAFKGLYDHNVPIIEALDNLEYLTQFYIGIAGTEMDFLEKNGERIIIAQQTHKIDVTDITDAMLICIDRWVSKTAALKLANELLKKSHAEPHRLEEEITHLKETSPNLKAVLKNTPRKLTLKRPLPKKVKKKQKITSMIGFNTTPFADFQQREFNEIELKLRALKKSMFFLQVNLENLNIAHFLDVFISHIELNKDTTFSINISKTQSKYDLNLTLVLPPNQRNFVERLAAALSMAGISVSIVRETALEDSWILPLGITHGTSLRISRKHKDYIQVLSSPENFISLFRSTFLSSLTLATFLNALETMQVTVICQGIKENKVAVEIILVKLHQEKAELDKFCLPKEFSEHFVKVRGRRALINVVKNLLLRHCTKGIKISLQELTEFLVGDS